MLINKTIIKETVFGLVDADLLCNGTRHPNLVLMKIAGYLRDHNIKYQLIIDDNEDIGCYKYIYVSKVFTFTKLPSFMENISKQDMDIKFRCGGTGFYALKEEPDFSKEREKDMHKLEYDPNLPGFNMTHQMPDYTIYEEYVQRQIAKGKNKNRYKDYLHYSIGFLTRGCIRKCPFCVNRTINHVSNYSSLSDFVDNSRPYIYLWDDNFLASKDWKTLLSDLQATNKSFQFRQGLDIRLITEEKAKMLNESKYHGDFIFAFDQIKDKSIIEQKLKIWKEYVKKTTKLYLFCGYKIHDDTSLLKDIIELFERIEILMKNGCLSYVMRHEDYKNHPLNNIYTQIARWCNQPQFYKKMSFKEFIYRNQYWAKTEKKCMSVRTYEMFINKYSLERKILEYYFNMKYSNLIESN